MEKKKMYVITEMMGSYDDVSMHVVAVTDDFEKGSNYVNKMNSIYESMEKKVNSYYKEVFPKWAAENPRPTIVEPTLINVPKWTGNQIITKEMRAERKNIEAENDKLVALARQPMLDWGKYVSTMMENWLGENLTEEERKLFAHKNDNRWDIEEADWL